MSHRVYVQQNVQAVYIQSVAQPVYVQEGFYGMSLLTEHLNGEDPHPQYLLRDEAGGITIGYGSKYSALDAGFLLEISVDDDFMYICVEAGAVGNARWKRVPLKQI